MTLEEAYARAEELVKHIDFWPVEPYWLNVAPGWQLKLFSFEGACLASLYEMNEGEYTPNAYYPVAVRQEDPILVYLKEVLEHVRELLAERS